MVHRFTLAAIAAALTLTGCAKVSTTDEQVATQKLANGPAQVAISHVISRTDDGSSIIVTVDGVDAAPLVPGQTTDLHLSTGKHKIGGYVPTLYGLGRVTIPPVEITALQDKVQHVTYSVLKDKPAFTAGAATPVPAVPETQTSDVVPAMPSITVATTGTENTAAAATSTTPTATAVSTENTTAVTTSSATTNAASVSTENTTAATATSTTPGVTQAVSSATATTSAHQG